MYDMYHYHRLDSGDASPASAGAACFGESRRGAGAPRPAGGQAAKAVQVALDRRDNGGDSGAMRDE